MHPFAMEMADEYLFGCVMTCIPSMSSMQLTSVLCQSAVLHSVGSLKNTRIHLQLKA